MRKNKWRFKLLAFMLMFYGIIWVFNEHPKTINETPRLVAQNPQKSESRGILRRANNKEYIFKDKQSVMDREYALLVQGLDKKKEVYNVGK